MKCRGRESASGQDDLCETADRRVAGPRYRSNIFSEISVLPSRSVRTEIEPTVRLRAEPAVPSRSGLARGWPASSAG